MFQRYQVIRQDFPQEFIFLLNIKETRAIGGSGTDTDPYRLSEVVVVGNHRGSSGSYFTNFGGSLYYTGERNFHNSDMYGITSNGIGTSGYHRDPNGNSFLQMVSNLWNSNLARVLVPDVFSINLSTSATALIGVNYEFSVNFITRGNDASFIPVITFAPGGQVGQSVFADASIGVSRGYFIVSDVRQLGKGKANERLAGWSVDGVVGVGKGVGGSLNASLGLDTDGVPVFFKIGILGGAAIGGGWSVGQSHTLIVKP